MTKTLSPPNTNVVKISITDWRRQFARKYRCEHRFDAWQITVYYHKYKNHKYKKKKKILEGFMIEGDSNMPVSEIIDLIESRDLR